jgi:hypothetical protein
MTGNDQKETVTDFDQFLLVFYLLLYPYCELDEAAAFIYNNGGGIYSRQDLSKRLKELDVTRKKASTEAYQAFLPYNVAAAYIILLFRAFASWDFRNSSPQVCSLL